MKLAALAKLIKADAYCKLYNVCYEAGGYDLYIGTRTGIYSLAGFPKAQNSDELAALLDISPNSWKDIQFGDECPESERNMDGMFSLSLFSVCCPCSSKLYCRSSTRKGTS